jgi:hypothetical protein
LISDKNPRSFYSRNALTSNQSRRWSKNLDLLGMISAL